MTSQPPKPPSEWLSLFSRISSLLVRRQNHPSPIPTPATSEPAADQLSDRDSVAQLIDHTLLNPSATRAQISVLCSEAVHHRFRTVCVRPSHVGQAKAELDGSEVGVACVIGFPIDHHPASYSTAQKVAEARTAVQNGATELDMVMDYERLKHGSTDQNTNDDDDDDDDDTYTAIYTDIHTVRSAIPPSTLLKVILETSQLANPDHILQACVISCLAGADYVKTSTGFRGHGATEDVVRLMRSVCDLCASEEGVMAGMEKGKKEEEEGEEEVEGDGRRVKVKASGGLRTMEDVRKMVGRAGADRIGASAGVAIMRELGP